MNYRAEYERWLTDPAFDEATVAELRTLAGDEHEIEDRFYTNLTFGTAGMRGVLGAGLNRMNVYNVRRATAALAEYILETPGQAQRGVAIAYDSRRCSALFAKAAALTLCARGVRAYLFDSLRPVPVLSFTIRHLNAIAGIVITASHNPPAYNGYKAYWEDGGQMPPERASEITRLIDTIDFADALAMDEAAAKKQGLLEMIGKAVDDAYIAAVKKLCVNPQLAREMGDKLKIVYTPLHGSGNLPVRRILKEIGFKQVYVVKEQELPDPDFSTVRVPNPEDPAAFTLALKLQESLNADVVFGTDPDCDRVGIAVKDASGGVHILSGNQIGCLLLDYILSQKAEKGELPRDGAVVKSIVTTELARAICQKYGVTLFDVLTGFKFIAEMIQRFEMERDYTFLFGFEESYGYLSGTDVRDKDGVNACMLIAETAAYYKKRGMTMYDALESLFATYGYYGEKVTSFNLTGKDGLEEMQRLMKRLREQPPSQFGAHQVLAVRDYQTGLREEGGVTSHLGLPVSNVLYYELDSGAWLCVRPSGTEPKIKLYVNAVTGSRAQTDAMMEAISQAAVAWLEG
ncbi:MAG: phospho-sugar mutase [Clostridia bacterium]